MTYLKNLYRKYETIWCNLVFPLILALYPFVTVNQGIDVSDSTYSLSNFLYFQQMEGMWVISTYLANLCGWLLTFLPFGTTLLGMKLYSGLLITATVLIIFLQLKNWMPAWIAFAGEFAAVSFLWIPSTILYNYLTYFLFGLGAVLLYKGLVDEKDSCLVMAGAALGLNVFVRIPNLTEAALILGLWYYLKAERKPLSLILQKTGCCIAGYLAGLAIPLGLILIRYGLGGLTEAITGLAAIQSADATYSPAAMVLSVISAYFRSGKWVTIIGIPTAFGMGMFAFKKGKYEKVKKGLFLLVLLVILRFLWGRGMFSFRYYEDYSSMYEWGMMGLFLAWISAVYMLGSVKTSLEEKLMAVMVMIILAVTPLGSNNYTYQNLNNLFLAAPFTLYTFVKLFRYKKGDGPLSGLDFPWKAAVAVMGFMILLQSTGFHLQFVFRDGMDGTPRDAAFSSPAAVAGMKTTYENAESFGGLYAYLEEEGLTGQRVVTEGRREAVFYGDCPGLSFLCQIPFAIGTAWPDLDSHPYESFVSGLEQVKEGTIVIIRNKEGDSEAGSRKKAYLLKWLDEQGYTCSYENGEYTVYDQF